MLPAGDWDASGASFVQSLAPTPAAHVRKQWTHTPSATEFWSAGSRPESADQFEACGGCVTTVWPLPRWLRLEPGDSRRSRLCASPPDLRRWTTAPWSG